MKLKFADIWIHYQHYPPDYLQNGWHRDRGWFQHNGRKWTKPNISIHSFQAADRSLSASVALDCCTPWMLVWGNYIRRSERSLDNPHKFRFWYPNSPMDAVLSCLRLLRSNNTCTADSSCRPHFYTMKSHCRLLSCADGASDCSVL